MENNQEIILGIETSCDETAVAIVKGGKEVVANVVASQIESHKRFGGVVPEIASRHHVEQMTLILKEALDEADLSMEDIDAIAVTEGPGLVGALLIGVNTAKALGFCSSEASHWYTPYCWSYLCESTYYRSFISITCTCCLRRPYRASLYGS